MLCGAVFVTLFSIDDTDDVAGFVIAMFVLQLPAFLGLDDVPLSAGRSVAVAVPAAIVGAFSAFFLFFLFDLFAALLGCVGSGLIVGLYLGRRPHPFAARRVLGWFELANLVGAGVVCALARRFDGALVVVIATPAAWAIPLLASTWRRRPEPAPVARVVR